MQSKNSKYRQGIYRVEGQIKALNSTKDSLYSEISKVENCFPKAKEFLFQNCVKTNVPSISYDSIIRQIPPPPYKTRFNRPLEEIAKMDISKMSYSQFLQNTANFKVSDNSFSVDVVSEDGLIRIPLYAIRGNMTIRQVPGMVSDVTYKFECYKSLSMNQKLKLLNEVTIRKN